MYMCLPGAVTHVVQTCITCIRTCGRPKKKSKGQGSDVCWQIWYWVFLDHCRVFKILCTPCWKTVLQWLRKCPWYEEISNSLVLAVTVQHCIDINYVPPVRTSWLNSTGERFGEFNTAMNQTSAMLYPAFTIYNRKKGNTKFRCSQGSLGT